MKSWAAIYPGDASPPVCGSAGCGETMLAVDFLGRGPVEFGEPGGFMIFQENAAELTAHVRSPAIDLRVTKS